MSEIDVTKCPFYYYDENYHQKENCTTSGSFSMGNPPCTRNCKWHVEQKLQQAMDNYDKLDLLREEQYNQLVDKYKAKEQEIKLAKEMLIQNDYTTNNKTLPQIIEDFMSDNLLDAQNDEGYTIPVFIQAENKLETLEDLERECEKLKTQILSLQTMEIEENKKLKQECEELRDILRKTKEYKEVCTTCKDEILIYPSISGRTDYTDEEVEVRTLKQIISTLQAKEQECEELKENNYNLNMSMYQYRSTQKENDRYKQALDEIEEYINSFPDFVKEADKIILDIINKAKE